MTTDDKLDVLIEQNNEILLNQTALAEQNQDIIEKLQNLNERGSDYSIED